MVLTPHSFLIGTILNRFVPSLKQLNPASKQRNPLILNLSGMENRRVLLIIKGGNKMKRSIQAVLGIILSFFMTTESFAVGSSFIGNEAPGARGAGEGYVGVAGTTEDLAAVYLNPGAITSLKGTQVSLGTTWENIHGSYQDNSGNQTKERVVNGLVPNFAVTQSFMDGRLGAGLAVESPYGLETNWDGNSPLRYVATNSRLRMVDVTPAVAYKISPVVSIGAGADYDNVFDAQLDRHINNDFVNAVLHSQHPALPASSGSPDAITSLRGTGANWGYHAGMVFQPTEQHSFGIAYHSKVNIRINGDDTVTGITGAGAIVFGGSTYSSSAYTDIVLPSSIQFGYSYKPNDKWQMEADAAWTHWSEAKNIDVRFPSGSLLSESVTPLDARDAWSMTSGANYKVNDHWQVRGGFWYEPYVIPDQNFSPAFMDQSRYGLSSGFGYAITSNLTMDFAYNAIFTHNRNIQNNVGQNSTGTSAATATALGIPNPDISGTYKDFGNSFALNLTYRFGNSIKS
jgi:long-chain fatty acid transport protein